MLNECRRLRDAEPRPAPSRVPPPAAATSSEPAGLAAARQLGVEASRFGLWVRESDAEGRVPPQSDLVERAAVLVALARQLEGPADEARRVTAALVRAGQAVLYGEGSREVPDLLQKLERELRTLRQSYGEHFVAVGHVEPEGCAG